MKRRDFLKGAVVGAGLLGSGMVGGRAIAANDWGKRKQGVDFYRIDSYSHFAPLDYLQYLEGLNGSSNPQRALIEPNPSMWDLAARLEMMDDCGIDLSILIPQPFLETAPNVYNNRTDALKAAQYINNEIAGIVAQNPTRFKLVAILPTQNYDDMITEFERAVTELGAVGACFIVSPTAKPPDHEDYVGNPSTGKQGLYGKAVELNVPLWIHPSRPATWPDYNSDPLAPSPPAPPNTRPSQYLLWLLLGWLLDSSVAMARIVFKGVFDTYPNLKLVIHHKGALVPLFQNRLTYDYTEEMGIHQPTNISKPYIEHFKKFYVDTVFSGNQSFETEIVKIAYDFFGPEHLLFGTDAAFSTNGGRTGTLNARYSVEDLRVPNKDIENIFSNNILNIIPH